MIVRYGRVEGLLDGEQALAADGHRVHWRGFAYLPGHPAGAPSLKACDWAAPDGALRSLKGSFALTVITAAGRHYAFTDAGGTHDAFLAPDARVVSTSFLGLCQAIGAGAGDLDSQAVAEFVDLGAVLGRRTPVHRIRRLAPGCLYELTRDGVECREVAGSGIAAPPAAGTTLERHFEMLATSLSGSRVSVDLTGGADSRLVAALLARDLDFECSVTGAAGYEDLPIAAEVAAALGRPLRVLGHEVDRLGADLDGLFEVSDGLADVLTCHRLRRQALARRDRGIDVAVGGLGGELYKDFWWLQDFPRYRSRRVNLGRLFDLRFRPVAVPPGLLAGDDAAGVRDRALAAMRERRMPLNTQTYDRVYHEMKMQVSGAHVVSMNSRHLAFAVPLLDLDLVRMGFELSRRARAFDRFHRQAVTRAAPLAAAIRTTQGVTLRASTRGQLADATAYAGDKAARLGRKARQRLFGTPLAQASPDHPALVPTARALPAFGRSVARLRAAGVLSAVEIPHRYTGRILTLGLLLDRLDG